MLILGIETSGRSGTVSVFRDQQVIGERELDRAGRRHARTLVSEVGSLFRDHQLAPSECDVVAVSVGPGSFTGLRVGVVFAVTFAYSTGCAVVAVDTMQVIAENVPPESPGVEHDITVLVDAQRGELFVRPFRQAGTGEWSAAADIRIATVEDFVVECRPETRIVGPVCEKLTTTTGFRGIVVPRDYWTPRAATVVAIAARRVAKGDFTDPRTLEPFYFRKSAAEEKADLSVTTRTSK